MSCGAGHSRRASNAVRRRGTNRRAIQQVKQKTVSKKPSAKTRHKAVNRRPRRGGTGSTRSAASKTASQTARAHARATASAHAHRTASAHAKATARANARKNYQQYLACLKKKRKAATLKMTGPGRPVVWRPKFRGRQHRGRRNVNPIFR